MKEFELNRLSVSCQCEEEDDNCNTLCEGSCQSSCQRSCQSGCQRSCQSTCERSCQIGCEKSCEVKCQRSCQSTCERSCQSTCERSCQIGCEKSCEVKCQKSCQSECERSCESTCEKSCMDSCETSCMEKCEFSCMTACEHGCMTTCEKSCMEKCEKSCMDSCETSCMEKCEFSCMNACENSCMTTCEKGSMTTCEKGCMTTCEKSCMTSCMDSCQTSCETTCQKTCQSNGQSGFPPLAPTSISHSISENVVTISFPKGGGSTLTRVTWQNGSKKGEKVTTGNSVSFTLEYGETYGYGVRAENQYGFTKWVTDNFEIPPVSCQSNGEAGFPPIFPTSVEYSLSGNVVTISFKKGVGSTKTRVAWQNGSKKGEKETTGNSVSFTLEYGETYGYGVRAENEYGFTKWVTGNFEVPPVLCQSNGEAGFPPLLPTSVKYSLSGNEVTISFQKGEGAEQTRVAWQNGAKKGEEVTTENNVSFTLEYGEKYGYGVRAENKYGFTKWVTGEFNIPEVIIQLTQMDIKLIKIDLKALGYNIQTINGTFDDNTKSQVKAFQQARGLKVNGIINIDTVQELLLALKEMKKLYKKEEGRKEDVVGIQQKLSSLGYYNSSIDGKFGTLTYNAIIEFQNEELNEYIDSFTKFNRRGVADVVTIKEIDFEYNQITRGITSSIINEYNMKLELFGLSKIDDKYYSKAFQENLKKFALKHGIITKINSKGARYYKPELLYLLREDYDNLINEVKKMFSTLGYYISSFNSNVDNDFNNAVKLFRIYEIDELSYEEASVYLSYEVITKLREKFNDSIMLNMKRNLNLIYNDNLEYTTEYDDRTKERVIEFQKNEMDRLEFLGILDQETVLSINRVVVISKQLKELSKITIFEEIDDVILSEYYNFMNNYNVYINSDENQIDNDDKIEYNEALMYLVDNKRVPLACKQEINRIIDSFFRKNKIESGEDLTEEKGATLAIVMAKNINELKMDEVMHRYELMSTEADCSFPFYQRQDFPKMCEELLCKGLQVSESDEVNRELLKALAKIRSEGAIHINQLKNASDVYGVYDNLEEKSDSQIAMLAHSLATFINDDALIYTVMQATTSTADTILSLIGSYGTIQLGKSLWKSSLKMSSNSMGKLAVKTASILFSGYTMLHGAASVLEQLGKVANGLLFVRGKEKNQVNEQRLNFIKNIYIDWVPGGYGETVYNSVDIGLCLVDVGMTMKGSQLEISRLKNGETIGRNKFIGSKNLLNHNRFLRSKMNRLMGIEGAKIKVTKKVVSGNEFLIEWFVEFPPSLGKEAEWIGRTSFNLTKIKKTLSGLSLDIYTVTKDFKSIVKVEPFSDSNSSTGDKSNIECSEYQKIQECGYLLENKGEGQMSCQSGCEISCESGCERSCQSGCEISCESGCERSCQSGCERSCQSGCEKSCQSICETSCQTICEATCMTMEEKKNPITVSCRTLKENSISCSELRENGNTTCQGLLGGKIEIM